MNSLLEVAFEFYLSHQDEMVKKYDGLYVIIKNGEVLGAYANVLDAVMETQKIHQLGTFLVQKVSKGDVEYSQTFHSRARFPR